MTGKNNQSSKKPKRQSRHESRDRSSSSLDENRPAKKQQKFDELLSKQLQHHPYALFFELGVLLGQGDRKKPESQVYGIPGPSQTQQSIIIISDDDEPIIKKEKCDLAITTSKKSENEPDTQPVVEKTKGKARAVSSEKDEPKKRTAKKGAGKKKAQGRSVSPSSSSSEDSKSTLYLTKDNLPKELKKALRREVNHLYGRLPENNQLNLSQTFTQQRNLVNSVIVPTIMSKINTDVFPIYKSIVYQMLHSLHRHRREEFLKEHRSQEFKIGQAKRKHSNTRRYDKRIKRAEVIGHLQTVNDRLIKNFKDRELKPIIDDNFYHSPEDSETDQENPTGKRNIVVRDLNWRSSALRMFLRNYIDRFLAKKSKIPKRRNRILDNNNYNTREHSAPFAAPKWTRAGYNGKLEHIITEACKEESDNNSDQDSSDQEEGDDSSDQEESSDQEVGDDSSDDQEEGDDSSDQEEGDDSSDDQEEGDDSSDDQEEGDDSSDQEEGEDSSDQETKEGKDSSDQEIHSSYQEAQESEDSSDQGNLDQKTRKESENRSDQNNPDQETQDGPELWVDQGNESDALSSLRLAYDSNGNTTDIESESEEEIVLLTSEGWKGVEESLTNEGETSDELEMDD